MTTVVWENEEAFENAKKTVATEFEKQGFGLQETRKKLKIESERAVYERSPYSSGAVISLGRLSDCA